MRYPIDIDEEHNNAVGTSCVDLLRGAITFSISNFAEIAAIGASGAATARESFIVRLFLRISNRPTGPWRSILGVERQRRAFITECRRNLALRPRLRKAAIRQTA